MEHEVRNVAASCWPAERSIVVRWRRRAGCGVASRPGRVRRPST